jgi:dienelactone hydrolase
MRPSRPAQFFVERGFAVLAPMRRGRGASDGTHEEYEGTCASDVLGAGFARAIEDVDAAMAYLRPQPWADPTRVVVAGQSRGGILSVAYAAERSGTVRAINSPVVDKPALRRGWPRFQPRDIGSRPAAGPTFPCSGSAEEDGYYSAAWIRRYQEALPRPHGVATFHLFPAFGADGHRLVDRAVWKVAADDFPRGLNLVSR